MYWKTDGVVLRETAYRDADKLLTVLTKDRGRVTLRARGVRSNRSRLKAPCQLLAFSEFTVFENRGFLTVQEAASKELFWELRSDLERLSLSSYFAHVAEVVSQEDSPNPQLLSLLLNCFYALGKLQKPQALVKAAFEVRIACLSGYEPDLSGCAVCGNPAADRFNVSRGVLQCERCRIEEDDGLRMPLGVGTLAALHYLTACDSRRLFSFEIGPDSLRELGDLAETYLTAQLERGFSTLDFYKSLYLQPLDAVGPGLLPPCGGKKS